MKLHELLQTLSFNTPIHIQNSDRKPRKPSYQYQAVKNITLYKIRNLLDKDVISIHHNEKGLWICVCDLEALHNRTNNRELLNEYFERIGG